MQAAAAAAAAPIPGPKPETLKATSMNQLPADEQERLLSAAKTYVYGDAASVSAWQPAIEKLLGPFEVSVRALPNITVDANNPWIIDGPGPQVVNVGTVTIKPGGQIIVKTTATINAAQMIKL
ncbi:hypothetical protein CCP1ISM_10490001 [Azospirillaceae bacterium]